MNILISDTLQTALSYQISHEMYNANLYLYMAGYLKSKGLDNIAKHFEEQWKEETEHSKVFFDLLADLNANIIIPQIAEIAMPFARVTDLAQAYLAREVLTTESINEIKKLAISQDNAVVEERMREMILRQQKELSESTTFLDRANLMPEWYMLGLWDASL